MSLTPSHWPRNANEGPLNAKPLVFWTPRELRPENEALLGNAGFTLARTPYTTPTMFRAMLYRPWSHEKMVASYPAINAACLEAWDAITKIGRSKRPEVVVLTTIKPMFRPLVDVITQRTGGYTIIVTPAGNESFIRVTLIEGRMRYREWIPSVEGVLERRRKREQMRGEGAA